MNNAELAKRDGIEEDPLGTKNTQFMRRIPKFHDGTLNFKRMGVVTTAHGTSCSGCTYYNNGHCMKGRVGGPRSGFAQVKPGWCCSFWEGKAGKSVAGKIEGVGSLVLNKDLFPKQSVRLK